MMISKTILIKSAPDLELTVEALLLTFLSPSAFSVFGSGDGLSASEDGLSDFVMVWTLDLNF
jgi:hypothetical protein